MLVDTDVFIWFMRGNDRAAAVMSELPQITVSAVTYIELVQGMRNKRELHALRATLAELNARVIAIDEVVSSRAMFLVEQHFHSHAVRLGDALIAATAITNGSRLLTANVKHYAPIKDLLVERLRPS